jgi:hypothetical protein
VYNRAGIVEPLSRFALREEFPIPDSRFPIPE